MAKKPETRLVQRIRDALESEVGGWWMKVHGGPFQAAGVPDILGCCGGMFFGFEVKTPTGKVSKIQLHVMNQIGELGGGQAHVVITPAQAVEVVKETLADAGRLPTGRRGVRRKSKDGGTVLRARNGKDVDRDSSSSKTDRSRRKPQRALRGTAVKHRHNMEEDAKRDAPKRKRVSKR